jgi:hypothetical protein
VLKFGDLYDEITVSQGRWEYVIMPYHFYTII